MDRRWVQASWSHTCLLTLALKAPLVEWLILFNYGQIQLGDTFSVKLMSENFDAESTASATNPTWIKDKMGGLTFVK